MVHLGRRLVRVFRRDKAYLFEPALPYEFLRDIASCGTIGLHSSPSRNRTPWDIDLGRVRCPLKAPSLVYSIAISSDGTTMICGLDMGQIIFDVPPGLG